MLDNKSESLSVIIKPNAKINSIIGFVNGVLHIRIAAPPLKGKANRELVDYLSGVLNISKTRLKIEKGLTSRSKILSIQGMTESVRVKLDSRISML